MHIDDCVRATQIVANGESTKPVKVGSAELVSSGRDNSVESGFLRWQGRSIRFDRLGITEVLHELEKEPEGWRVIVTPNLRHMTLLADDPGLLPLYDDADIVLADGWPVARILSHQARRSWARATGADLLEGLFAGPGGGRPLVIVGGENSLELRRRLSERAAQGGWRPLFEPAPPSEVGDALRRERLADDVASKGAHGAIVVGLGAPKQERFAYEVAGRSGSGWIFCVGMAVNFSAGTAPRAPQWVQSAGLEWAHRALCEPRRLGRRYARDVLTLARLLRENWRRVEK
jgi:N-acetylglucosaminyldiphosphoundecaprenol N-acetyl-beta-D-mannosaminyltransferase